MCDYDSTWESDGDDAGESQTRRSSQDKPKSNWGLFSNNSSRNMRAAKDMQNYRRGYPNLTDEECSEDKMINLKFYLNEYRSSPDDVSIDTFLKDWKTDYKRLERVHSYIQWLFPLREPGVNYMASELTLKEIKAFKENSDAKRRLVESYELMLGFYGISLVNQKTGEVKRADNWRERFNNLERNMHNNLRITRILKSLGELGLEHYQAPLVHFFLEETLVKKTLSGVKRSVLDYFLFAVRNKKERKELLRYAYQQYEPKDKFVWCPRKIQKQLKKAEKKLEATGTRDGVEEGRSRPKGKEAVTGASPNKDKDRTEDVPETQRDEVASKDSDKLSDGSNVDTQPEFQSLEYGNDNVDMDHSGSADPDSGKGESDMEGGHKDGIQTPVKSVEPTTESKCEKKQKKKREGDIEMSSNGSTGDLTNGQVIPGTVNSDESLSDQSSLSGAASVKAKTESSSSSSSGPGEKIPRFSVEPVIEEGGASTQPAMNQENNEEAGGDQTNGKDSVEMDVESTTQSSDDMGHS